MSLITGTLPAAASYTLAIDNLKTLFSTYLSDYFELLSDTGTADDRILAYMYLKGNGFRVLKVYKSDSMIYMQTYVDQLYTSSLGTAANILNIASSNNYVIVLNENSMFLYLRSYPLVFANIGDNGISSSIRGNNTSACVYSSPDPSTSNWLFFDNAIRPSYLADDGSEILLPLFTKLMDGTALCSTPCPDMYGFKNQLGLAIGKVFYVGDSQFVVMSSTTCIRVNP